jgi:hypothetical protein
MVENYAVARLRNELRELSQNEDSGFSVGLKTKTGSNGLFPFLALKTLLMKEVFI